MPDRWSQESGGTALMDPPASGAEFLTGDVLTTLWSAESDSVEMAKKKKKKPARKPAKKPKKKPRRTKNRPGCMSTDPTCITGR